MEVPLGQLARWSRRGVMIAVERDRWQPASAYARRTLDIALREVPNRRRKQDNRAPHTSRTKAGLGSF
jgi:hypothetical protein